MGLAPATKSHNSDAMDTYKDAGEFGLAAADAKSSTSGRKDIIVYSVHCVLFFCALVLLFLGCWSWNHHDVSGQCMLLNSGTTYLYEINSQCANRTRAAATKNCPCPTSSTLTE